MMLLLLSGPNGPLGHVIHHFVRIEYQHRGTQHAHILLWIDGAPGIDATDKEVRVSAFERLFVRRDLCVDDLM